MAPRSRSSLISQLADFSNVAPEDKDPLADDGMDADGHHSGSSEGGNGSDEEEEDDGRRARAHYIDVGPSRLRREADVSESDVLRTGRYAGQRASARDMLGLANSDEEEVDDGQQAQGDESQEEDDEGSEDRSEEEEDEDEESLIDEEGNASSEGEESKAGESEEEQESDFVPEQEDGRSGSNGHSERKASASQTRKTAAQSDQDLLRSLRQRNQEDAKRGRDVQKQLDAWGSILGLRIRAQKVVRASGRLQPLLGSSSAGSLPADAQESRASALESLHHISQHLFSVERNMIMSLQKTTDDNADNDAVDVIDEHLSNGKRRRPEDVVSTLVSVDEASWPLGKVVLDKWSLRSNLEGSAGAASKHANRFDSSNLKAMNQRATEQIDALLSGDGLERLRIRTRVWRGTEAESRLVPSLGVNGEANETGADDESEEDVFDDSDFYQALLRELIDNKAGERGAVEDSSYAWADAVKKASKKSKNVDTRASKGRRLRYEVHDKVQNFMPPIPRETWTEAQIDRLVLQLRGEEEELSSKEQPIAVKPEVDLQNFKLFG